MAKSKTIDIEEILELEDGDWLDKDIKATVKKCFPKKKTAKGHLQNVTIEDDTGEIRCTFWSQTIIKNSDVGKEILIELDEDGKGIGVKAAYKGKGVELNVGDRATITLSGSGKGDDEDDEDEEEEEEERPRKKKSSSGKSSGSTGDGMKEAKLLLKRHMNAMLLCDIAVMRYLAPKHAQVVGKMDDEMLRTRTFTLYKSMLDAGLIDELPSADLDIGQFEAKEKEPKKKKKPVEEDEDEDSGFAKPAAAEEEDEDDDVPF